MLVVAKTINDADEYGDILRSGEFFGGAYGDAVLVVHSDAPDEALAALAAVEEPGSPVRIVMSVGMLKEGWDVGNVYVIASIWSSVSEILTEQALGRACGCPSAATPESRSSTRSRWLLTSVRGSSDAGRPSTERPGPAGGRHRDRHLDSPAADRTDRGSSASRGGFARRLLTAHANAGSERARGDRPQPAGLVPGACRGGVSRRSHGFSGSRVQCQQVPSPGHLGPQ